VDGEGDRGKKRETDVRIKNKRLPAILARIDSEVDAFSMVPARSVGRSLGGVTATSVQRSSQCQFSIPANVSLAFQPMSLYHSSHCQYRTSFGHRQKTHLDSCRNKPHDPQISTRPPRIETNKHGGNGKTRRAK
jgi:hypothetical protein